MEITKIQILKVIHNYVKQLENPLIVVGNHKGTNFESNSQRLSVILHRFFKLLEITKIQILKVIHNQRVRQIFSTRVVESHKDTNFESNSQL